MLGQSALVRLPGAEAAVVMSIPRSPARANTRARLTLTQFWDITTDVGVGFPRQPSPATNWTTLAGSYDEFCVHGMRARWFLPKAGTVVVGSTFQGGTLTGLPGAVAMAYDNNGTVVPTFPNSVGYSTSVVEAPEGVVGLSIPRLPVGMVASTGIVGGTFSNSSSQWTAVSSVADLQGVIFAVISGLATGTWSSPPAALLLPAICEWDVELRYRDTA